MTSASDTSGTHRPDLGAYIRTIPDFPRPGIQFRDIAPLLASPDAFRQAARLMAEPWLQEEVTRVVGIEARGFLFAAAVALELNAGVVMARKPGKLPGRTARVEYDLEYGTDAIEMHADGIGPGDVVVIIDDVLATGGTLAAAAELTARMGAEVRGAGVLIELEELRGRSRLDGVRLEALLKL